MARIVSLTILTALIVFLGITFFKVVAPFLLPLFLAGVVAILCQPMFRYFIARTNNRVRVAAGMTTALVLAVMLVPVLVVTVIASLELYALAVDALGTATWEETGADIERQIVARIERYLPQEVETEQIRQNLRTLLQTLAARSLGLAGTTLNKTLSFLAAVVSLLVSLMMFSIALYYFLADGPALISAAEGLIPVHVDYQRELRHRFEQVVRAVVMATFLAAIAQGIATAAAIFLTGWAVDAPVLRHFFIFSLLGTLVALVPLMGTWLIWVPAAVWCLAAGHWFAALFLTLFGSVAVGTMDNVIRTYVLHSDARLHPLLAFISVLGGLQVMGLWGIFIGPIVASCLHALVQIFNTELKEFSKEKFALVREQRQPDESAEEDAAERKEPYAAGEKADSEAPPAETTVNKTKDRDGRNKSSEAGAEQDKTAEKTETQSSRPPDRQNGE